MIQFLSKLILFFIAVFVNSPLSTCQSSWRFAVVGDTHVGSTDTVAEMIPYMLEDSIDFIVVVGDLVEGGLGTPGTQLLSELDHWKNIFNPIYSEGIPVYGIRGNHEDDANNDINNWNTAFSGSYAFPQNGPFGETNLTYSFTHKNAKMILLDDYKTIHKVNQTWLDQELSTNNSRHLFVFGHEAAFKVFHADCLDDSLLARNTFWTSLKNAGTKVYFCGHDHFLDAALVDDGDGNIQNDIYQYLVGTGGGWLMSQYSNYNGDNGPFSPNRLFHEMEYGYSLVEINGDSSNDCDVTIRWKKRVTNSQDSSNLYVMSEHVINYSACQTSALNALTEEDFNVYPNPVNDLLFLSTKAHSSITIKNLFGQVILQNYYSKSGIDISNFKPGVYLIESENQSSLFIKE